MNLKRLSTNLPYEGAAPSPHKNIQERIQTLLDAPSNYEIHTNGKIFIKSSGVYLKGRGNVSLEVLDDKGFLVYSFDSIKQCAKFFGVSEKTIFNRMEKGNTLSFNNQYFTIKRIITLP